MPAPRSPLLALLFGDPVAHSLSPRIHTAAFRAAGIEARYLASRVPAGALGAAIAGLRADHILGANVTIPHKEAAAAIVDELSETAAGVGAVNTIVPTGDGRLVGHNTDVGGFLAPLAEVPLDGSSVVILGAGGAARAAAFALLAHTNAGRVTLASRRPEQAEAVVRHLAPWDASGVLRAAPLADAAPAIREAALLVNATPAGMDPDVDGTPWPDAGDFSASQIVYEMVYEPRTTRFLADAAASGARTIGGIEMLLAQAAGAFELWTGQPFPMAEARRAVQ
jgi:shikimate dehydrogenase